MEHIKITMHGNPLTLSGQPIQKGDSAPDFSALDQQLKPVKLSDFEDKIIIISAFPSIDTPVCSAQMHRFNQIATGLDKDVVLLTISCDLPFALHRYCAAEGIQNAVVLSDYKDTDFGTKYGFLIQELRLLTRGVVVIGKDRQVKYVEYVPEITHEPDYEKPLEAVKQLLQ